MLLGLAMFLVGCATGKPVEEVIEAPTNASAVATSEKVRRAIQQAGVSLGWQMRDQGPGRILGSLLIRNHVAKVDITYNPRTYSITYNDSENLQYDPAARTINRGYNRWIMKLNQRIQAQLSIL